jgi:SAM-dependent methyltransferase
VPFSNTYEDPAYAAAYAALEFPGTYYLAYRDLPAIINRHVKGLRAVDFGCGAGRSTRFLRALGFDVVAVDIAGDMIRQAREMDPSGDYRLVARGELAGLVRHGCDLVLSAFTFDNIPTRDEKVASLISIGRLLSAGGVIVSLVSSPEIYTHEWASFSTKAFPENRDAQCGDVVRIVITEIEDARPVEDVVWTDEGYRDVFRRSGLRLAGVYRPLAREDEPYPWINETRIAPWVIYVLRKEGPASVPRVLGRLRSMIRNVLRAVVSVEP